MGKLGQRDAKVSLHKIEAILIRLGGTCTRKQAKANACVTCTELYKRLDALARRSSKTVQK